MVQQSQQSRNRLNHAFAPQEQITQLSQQYCQGSGQRRPEIAVMDALSKENDKHLTKWEGCGINFGLSSDN